MCLKPILKDGSFIDAQGNEVIGFGEIKKVDDGAAEIVTAGQSPLLSGVAVGVSTFASLLRMLLLYRHEQKNSKQIAPRDEQPAPSSPAEQPHSPGEQPPQQQPEYSSLSRLRSAATLAQSQSLTPLVVDEEDNTTVVVEKKDGQEPVANFSESGPQINAEDAK